VRELTTWWQSLGDPPPAWSAAERRAAWLVALIAAISRWMATSKTPWDWDESLFMAGVRAYDVTAHHPHPPGFPLYVGAAKLLAACGVSAFHALQTVTFLSAVAVAPAAMWLVRELRLPAFTAIASGALLAFLPNVWFYGGTVFSDVPSMVIVVVAIALLVRGCRSDRAFYAGALVLGIAASFRVQNLMMGCGPALLACVRGRRAGRVIAAAGIGAGVIAASYGAAAHFSHGWDAYINTVRWHQHWILAVDSYHNPSREPLRELAPLYFFAPFRALPVNVAITALAAISLIASIVRLRAPLLVVILAFGPFAVAAWLLLDPYSASRMSVGYMPLFAILAADGLHLLAGRIPTIERVAATAAVALMIVWMIRPLHEVHRHPAPTWAAVQWIRQHVDLHTARVYAHFSMLPMIEAWLPDVKAIRSDALPAPRVIGPDDIYVTEGIADGATVTFARPHEHLGWLVRPRYFETSVVRLQQAVHFDGGWYDEEGEGAARWRWMGKHAECTMPPARGNARLTLHMRAPVDVLPSQGITVTLNGAVLDHFRFTREEATRSYVVAARGDAPNRLALDADQIINLAARRMGSDARDLGIRIDAITWTPQSSAAGAAR
jgi:hypothetical protein